MSLLSSIKKLFHSGWDLEQVNDRQIKATLPDEAEAKFFGTENDWVMTTQDPALRDDLWEEAGGVRSDTPSFFILHKTTDK